MDFDEHVAFVIAAMEDRGPTSSAWRARGPSRLSSPPAAAGLGPVGQVVDRAEASGMRCSPRWRTSATSRRRAARRSGRRPSGSAAARLRLARLRLARLPVRPLHRPGHHVLEAAERRARRAPGDARGARQPSSRSTALLAPGTSSMLRSRLRRLGYMRPSELRIIVLEGDETGQELLEQALRVLDPAVTRVDGRARALRPLARQPAQHRQRGGHRGRRGDARGAASASRRPPSPPRAPTTWAAPTGSCARRSTAR